MDLNIKEVVGKLIGSIFLSIGLFNGLFYLFNQSQINISHALYATSGSAQGTNAITSELIFTPLILPLILCIIGFFLLFLNYSRK